MREIVFRGKMKKTGQWILGDYVRLHDGDREIHLIYGKGEIDPETLGQYIGIDDKNGKKIFEGDILSFVDGDGDTNYLTVIYDRDMFTIKECDFVGRDGLWSDSTLVLEVVGNIYDNSNLLEERDND